MKSPPHPNSEPNPKVLSAPMTGTVNGRERTPRPGERSPSTTHRRYPSLSDDGQPWFPPYVVRAFALLALIVIIVALVVAD